MLTLHHGGLVVESVDASRKYYVDFLGMEEVPRPARFVFDGAWFKSGDTEIHVITAKDTTASAGMIDQGEGKRTGLALHFGFEVDNLYDLHEKAQSLPDEVVRIVGGPMGRGDGVHQMYTEDPDGNLLEIFQWIDEGETSVDRTPVSE